MILVWAEVALLVELNWYAQMFLIDSSVLHVDIHAAD